MDIQEIQTVVRQEINSSTKISNIEEDVSTLKQDVSTLKQDVSTLKQDVSRIGILQEELNSKMDFVLDALQPVIEKIQSVKKIEIDIVKHDEDIDVTKNALRAHITDNTRHV